MSITSDYSRFLTTIGRCYASALTASVEVGGQAVRESAAEASYVARTTAHALRAPEAGRAAALDAAARTALDAQRRQLHGLRGLSAMWGMAALHHFDASRSRPDDT